ncbi:hypothetical protein scyTo_0010117 [Scyliorhinus torazame]|uniref:Uncharacterized protein n=1 Tax=Scyliorhinus torazame TaxID=75743 RepID=A0A401P0C3_SCYTO|nr:hypothetical protein [Scyliorhinus torazame]
MIVTAVCAVNLKAVAIGRDFKDEPCGVQNETVSKKLQCGELTCVCARLDNEYVDEITVITAARVCAMKSNPAEPAEQTVFFTSYTNINEPTELNARGRKRT